MMWIRPPATCAALTYSCSRSERNCPRTNRASVTHPDRPIARKMLSKPRTPPVDEEEHHQELWDRVDDIDHPHQDVVRRTAEIAGDADGYPDQEHDRLRETPTTSETRAPVDHAAEHVPPVGIEPHRPESMGPASASRKSTTSA